MVLSLRKCVGRNLKSIRLYNNLTQAQMAEISKMSRGNYIQCEAGNRPLDSDSIYFLCKHFCLDLDLVFVENYNEFLSRLSSSRHLSEECKALLDAYNSLSSFSKGRLVQFSQRLIDEEKIKKQRDELLLKNKKML